MVTLGANAIVVGLVAMLGALANVKGCPRLHLTLKPGFLITDLQKLRPNEKRIGENAIGIAAVDIGVIDAGISNPTENLAELPGFGGKQNET